MLALENRVARLEEHVARLSVALSAATLAAPAPGAVDAPPADPTAAALPRVGDYAEARALAAEGRRIEAIKVVREQSGMGLRAAKDLVESW
jgi:large subunit ribosomal protein L7/L12